jgi:LysR family cyn operon transcriptional activator
MNVADAPIRASRGEALRIRRRSTRWTTPTCYCRYHATMEIHNLRCFLAVAELESFTRAAKKMHMSQSNLSHHIKELELRVGVPLFERLGRRVRLTTAGNVLRDHASRAIRMLDDAIPAIAELDNLSRGQVAVGVVQVLDHLLVPRVISHFTRSHPGIGIRVDRLWQLDMEAALKCGDVDLGIGLDPPRTAGVEFEPLFATDFAIIVPDDHHLAGRRSLTLPELGCEPLLLVPRKGSWLRWFTDEAFDAAKVEPKCSVQLDSVEATLAAIKQGIGVALLPVAVLGRGRPGLRSITVEGSTTKLGVGLLWGVAVKRSRAAMAFAEATAHVIRSEGLTPLG